MIKRLGIFQMHDPEGFVDDYIVYLLNDLVKNLSELVIVCNGYMDSLSLDKLKQITSNVFVREDTGFDCTAFKEVLSNYYGWDKIYKFDELVLVNDSCYGPIYAFSNVFDEMEVRNSEFWGITGQQPVSNSQFANFGNYLPYHIQPYFLVIRQRMLHSVDFKEFWETLGEINHYSDAVANYELRLTKFFNDRGYSSETYVDSSIYASKNYDDNYIYIAYEGYELISKYKCPLIKRKNFVFPLKFSLILSNGDDASQAFNFIKQHTDYDENLIWSNLLRLYNVADLRNTLHLNYVLPSQVSLSETRRLNRQIAVILNIKYDELIENCAEYFKNIPSDFDIVITTHISNSAKKIEQLLLENEIKNYQIVETNKMENEASALLVTCRDYLMKYEYICFLHDIKTNGIISAPIVGKSYMKLLWDNTLKSRQYIENVIQCFDENRKLGVLVPPIPYHSHYFSEFSETWGSYYSQTKKLSEKLKIKCSMVPDKQPYTLGTTFWCRPTALKALFEYPFEYSDFYLDNESFNGNLGQAVERILAYVAQHEGYYTGSIMTTECASNLNVNYAHMLSGVLDKYIIPDGIFKFADIDTINSSELQKFCNKYKKIYIYGAGMYGTQCIKGLYSRIDSFMGFIVSDGRRNKNNLGDYKIYEWSEVELNEDVGIILALSKVYQNEIIPILESNFFKSYVSYVL